MAYTDIQCIAYQVPTVAKVFNNTDPGAVPTMPNINNYSIRPSETAVPNTNIPIYNNNNYTLSSAPAKDYTKGSDYKKWLPYGKEYLGKLIGYLENPANSTTNEINAMITYLKYWTDWGDWTIPSAADQNNTAVGIVQVNSENAYELKGSDSFFTNTKYIDDLDSDAKNRVVRFLNVLYKASIDANVDKSITTLKVFMAPEFYFRPETPVTTTVNGTDYDSAVYRAYTYDVYKAIKEVLQQTIKGMGLNHWLIIPGTIMWYMPAGTTANHKSVTANTYFNSCIYIYNYSRVFNQQTSHKLEKAKASHIDGVPYNDWDYGANAPIALNKYSDDTKLNKHLFDISTLKTGLEICLEHKMYHSNDEKYGVLTKRIVKDVPSSYNGKYRHLQLLTAGGMPINDNSIALKEDGVFFRNDGLKQDSIYFDTYVYAAKYIIILDDGSLIDIVGDNNEVSLNNDVAFKLRSPLPDPPGNLELLNGMSFDQQNIVIYPTQKIS